MLKLSDPDLQRVESRNLFLILWYSANSKQNHLFWTISSSCHQKLWESVKKCPGERFRQCFAVIELGTPMVVHVRSRQCSLLTALSSTIYPAVRCNVSSLSIVALHCTALLHLHNYNYNHSPTQARALQPRGGEANNLNGRSPLGSALGSVARLVTICLAKYWGVEESPSTFLSEDESLLSCNLEGTLQQRRIIYLIWDHACILETYFWSPNPVPSII